MATGKRVAGRLKRLLCFGAARSLVVRGKGVHPGNLMTPQSRGRVLVVDDNSELRELIGDALVHEGYEVTLASDGSKGVEALRSGTTDLAITDIFMPEKDGIEVIGLLKKEFPDTPILAISGAVRHSSRAGVDYLSIARKFGADRVLRKPFQIDELLDAVREVLEAHA
jgi:CheY-like chemotaxis protein